MPDAVVLAGGTESGELFEATGLAYRPLLEVGGRPIIHRVLAALRGATSVGQVILVAPPEVHQAVGDEAVDHRVTASESFVENVVGGVEAVSAEASSVLVVTGDLPLLTPAAVNDLCQQAALAHADAVYPIIPRESCERAFPGGKRTYVRLREGVFTGGNVMVLARDFVSRRRELVDHLFASRKNPLKLAAMFGLGFVLGVVTHRLTLPQLEARAGKIIHGRVAAVITTYPELGFDVDKVSDLLLARQVAEGFPLG
ncbi:MAG: NTP transferase domain-containing protein [Armatimonadota bacterium]